MIGGWILCKICQKAGNGRSAPLLLLPPWRVALGILGLGILMPMFLYFAYTRWSGLSSYENSFRDFRVFLELALLTVTYLATSAELAAAYIRKRCQTLDLPRQNRLTRAGENSSGGGLALPGSSARGQDNCLAIRKPLRLFWCFSVLESA